MAETGRECAWTARHGDTAAMRIRNPLGMTRFQAETSHGKASHAAKPPSQAALRSEIPWKNGSPPA